jgi:hypothetical protein
MLISTPGKQAGLKLTTAQKRALQWLSSHNGDGIFDQHNVLLAAGERGPFMKATWNFLTKMGLLQTYNLKRVRITPEGYKWLT